MEVRSRQSGEEWKTRTDRIMKAVTGHPWFLEADALYCYVDFKGEVGTRGMIERALELEKNVYVPALSRHKIDIKMIFKFKKKKNHYFKI